MEFGYFTLSDNHYDNNPRGANEFIANITAEALYADTLGMHSAWIGEHHFNSLGVLSCPDLVLSYIAGQTKHIRLAPAVTVLPLHHPIRVAEQWATLDLLSNGRVDFAAGAGLRQARVPAVPCVFRRQSGDFRGGHGGRAQAVGGGRPHLTSRPALLVRRRADHPEARAAADPGLHRLLLQALDRACGPARLRPDRGAVRGGDELRRAQTGGRSLSRDLRQAREQARQAHVQLFHASGGHVRAGDGAACASG